MIAWTCDSCRQTIKPGTGYIYVRFDDIHTYEWWQKARDAEQTEKEFKILSLSDVLEGPDVARWNVHHHSCDPDREAPSYWIPVETWATARDGFCWASHLLGKTWIQATDFDRLLRRVADGMGPEEGQRKSS